MFKPIENASDVLFRASGVGYLMKDPRDKNELIADSVITHMIDLFISSHHGRLEEKENKFIWKGKFGEEDAITLLSRILKIRFKKNTIRLSNEFVTGELDLFLGKSITEADETFDTKASWSLHTFLRAEHAKMNDIYYWQGQSYMWLSGAKKHTIAYCLVNGSGSAIRDEKRILSYQSGMMDEFGNESEDYIMKCKQIEINHIFDIQLFQTHNPGFDFHNDLSEWCYDIPKEQRVHTFTFNRNEDDIDRLRKRIRVCRNWMNRKLFKL